NKRNMFFICRFIVKDTGLGIPESKKELVFESFKQVENNLSAHGGTGLGLPICRKLIRMMKGEIYLESKEGFGSQFSFTIPIEKGNMLIPKDAKESIDQIKLHLTVLLAEDNKANQFIAKSFLEKWGVDLTIVNNGQEAIECIKSKKFDLVLMDVRMPIIDGYTATKHIRNQKEAYFQEIPIIAMTASTMTDIRKGIEMSEFSGYLGKPFDPKELYQLLHGYDVSASATPEVPQEILEEKKSADRDIIERLNEYTEGDPTFFVEFTQNILNNLTNVKAEILQNIAKGDLDELREQVHMIKPSAEIIGSFDLMERLSKLKENMQKGERLNEEEVARLFDRDIACLTAVLEEKGEKDLITH
ncbi:MAG: response regulator, partial [Bacteroidota bacterium]